MKRSLDSSYVEDFVKSESDSMCAEFKAECDVLDSDSEGPTVVYNKSIKNPKLGDDDVLESCMVSALKFPNSNGVCQMDFVNGVSESRDYVIGVNANLDPVLDCTVDCSNGIVETSNTNNNLDFCTTNLFESSLFTDCLKSTNISCFGTGWANYLKTNCVDSVPERKNCVTDVESADTNDALEVNYTKNFCESLLFLDGSKYSNMRSSGTDCAAVVFESSLYLDRSKPENIKSSKMICAAVDGSNNANKINDSLLNYDSDEPNFDYVNDGSKATISSKLLNRLKSPETCHVPKTDCARVLPFSNSSDIDDSQKKYFNRSKASTRNKVQRHCSIDIIAKSTKRIKGSNYAQTNDKPGMERAKFVKNSTKFFDGSNSANPTNDPTKVYLELLVETEDTYKNSMNMNLGSDKRDLRSINNGHEFDCIDGQNEEDTHDSVVDLEYSEFVDDSKPIDTNVSSGSVKIIKDVANDKLDCVDEISEFFEIINDSKSVCSNDSKIGCADVSSESLITTSNCTDDADDSILDFQTDDTIPSHDVFQIPHMSRTKNGSKRVFSVSNFSNNKGSSTKYFGSSNAANSTNDPTKVYLDFLFEANGKVGNGKQNYHRSLMFKPSEEHKLHSGNVSSCDNNDMKNFEVILGDSTKCSEELSFVKSQCNPKETHTDIVSRSLNFITDSKSNASNYVAKKSDADVNSENLKCSVHVNLTDTNFNATSASDTPKCLNGSNLAKLNSSTLMIGLKSARTKHMHEQNLAAISHNTKCLSNMNLTDTTFHTKTKDVTTISDSEKDLNGLNHTMANYIPNIDCSETTLLSTKSIDDFKSSGTNVVPETDCANILSNLGICSNGSKIVSEFSKFVDGTKSASTSYDTKPDCDIVSTDSSKCVDDSNLLDTLISFNADESSNVASTSTKDPRNDYSHVNPESAESNSNAIDYEMHCPIFTIRKKQLHCPKDQCLKYEDCIPLLVQDIVKIKIGKNMSELKSIYGINFQKIMIYGQAIPLKLKFDTNERIYSVDDGTGSVTVKFRHTLKQLQTIRTLDTLTSELIAIKRERYTKRDQTQHKQHDSLVKGMDILLRKCKKQNSLPMEFFTRGTKVSVIGIPYSHHDVMYLWATEMIEDSEPNRSKEIFFKQSLIRYYKEIYAEHRID